MRRGHRLLVAAGMLAPACSRGTPTGTTAVPAPPAAVDEVGPTSSSSIPAPTTTEEPTTTAYTITLPTTPPTTTTIRPRPLPTTTLPERADEGLTDAEWWQGQDGYVDPQTGRDALLACIRSYEGVYTTDTGNGYYGAYQFDLATWRSVGGTGNPAHAPAAEQDARAWSLYLARGLAPWPTPARRCS